jgi:hypothetical protein
MSEAARQLTRGRSRKLSLELVHRMPQVDWRRPRGRADFRHFAGRFL